MPASIMERYLMVLLASAVSYVVLAEQKNVKPGAIFSTADNIRYEGYVSETHRAVTPDGYILEMHRIPFRRNETEGDMNRPVVLMMHGLLAASNCYVVLGRERGLAFNLADAGYDVWMGNARGTKNSRYHVTKDPNNTEHKMDFFDFSWDDIGAIDLPTMIDYILQWTGKEKLHYIGHSQGGTVFLVLNTIRPEYQDKIASAHLLAGVGYMDNFPNFFLKPLATFTTQIWNLGLRLGYLELFPPGALTIPFPLKSEGGNDTYALSDYCVGDTRMKYLCELFGVNEIMRDIDIGLLIGYQPGGAALKQVAHYGQNIKDKAFRRWDFGPEGNMAAYGTSEPPVYDISQIKVNVCMHYTVSDTLLDERDVLAMARVMPNTYVRKVARDSFTHADFAFSKDAKELVYEYIIEEISKSENSINESVTDATDSSAAIVLSALLKIYLITYTFTMYFSM